MVCIRLAILLLFVGSPVSSQESRAVNHLAHENSPYLLQHSHNPVDWYPWGPEALQRAKREDKPIFLSIGYSACHWCHVMEHESFENPEIAALMNEKFINIKVDREERPDLDEIYMTAVVAFTNGHGGWPMSVFLTPDREPFFGGTYYPPEDSRGMPGFRRVLEHVDYLWRERRADVEERSGQLVEYLQQQLKPKPTPGEPLLAYSDKAVAASHGRYDATYGGFGQAPQYAPKFPHASELSLLLRHYARTGAADSLEMVEHTLQMMVRGGVYDQLGGGFHCYSVDRVWLVPHFEKMLYDNALLARTLAETYQATGKELYVRVLRETLDYLLREMQDSTGGFHSTQDADSEGQEGKFFVWQKEEFDRVLRDDAAIAGLRFGVTDRGNWEHENILTAAMTVQQVAERAGKSEDQVRAVLRRARAALLAQREQRVHPGTDDKVLAAWNGMAIAACAVGYQVTGEQRYLEAARRAAAFVLSEMRVDGRLLRSWRAGVAAHMGYLEDYAFVADGLLCLFEADFDPRWLSEAKALLSIVEEHFLDQADGGFFFTADDHEELLARNKSISESSIPSGQAMAILAFLRAGLLLGDTRIEDIGIRALRANNRILELQPIASPTLVLALELYLSDPREIVIAGEPGDAVVQEMLLAVRRRFPPHHVVTLVHSGNRERLLELAPVYEGKDPIDGAAAAYVCRHGVCDAPVTDPGALELGK